MGRCRRIPLADRDSRITDHRVRAPPERDGPCSDRTFRERAENVDLSAAWSLNVDDWAQLDVPMSDSLGKYDAILRLPDIDGIPAYTFTTARLLPLGDPAPAYRELIEAISGRPLVHAAPDGPRDNRDYLPPSRRTSIDVPARGSRVRPHQPAGSARDGRHRNHRRAGGIRRRPSRHLPALRGRRGVGCQPRRGACRCAPHPTAGRRAHPPLVRITPAVRPPSRTGGRHPGSDVVHTSPADAERLGKWALLSVPGRRGPYVSSPAEQSPRGTCASPTPCARSPRSRPTTRPSPFNRCRRQYPSGSARENSLVVSENFFSGLRPSLCDRRRSGRRRRNARGACRRHGARPPRCSSGDTVIVSWAHRTARARVLLHTESTRVRMRAQLGEKTGHQSRASVGDVAARLSVPEHLQAWTSSTLRHELGIPPDTLVRIRRSVGHVVAKNAALLALPVTGVVFAAAAIPGVSQWHSSPFLSWCSSAGSPSACPVCDGVSPAQATLPGAAWRGGESPRGTAADRARRASSDRATRGVSPHERGGSHPSRVRRHGHTLGA